VAQWQAGSFPIVFGENPRGWGAAHFSYRLGRVRPASYVLERTDNDTGVSNRAANLDVVALGNMLKFARDEGWLKGELPTDSWKPLKYVPPRRSLLTWDQIQAICDEALAMNDGQPKYENGQFLADFIKLLAFSGARRQAALMLCKSNGKTRSGLGATQSRNFPDNS
jgi:hypothetical protein